MYKLSVGVGYSMFKMSLENPLLDKVGFINKLEQHRIILSPAIINYYKESLPEYEEQIDGFIDSVIYSEASSHTFPDSNETDAKQNIIDLVKQVPMKTLVSQKEEFEGYSLSKISFVTPDDIIERTNKAFNRYTFPIANLMAKDGDNCESYSKWFGHLFENEERITFLDPYFFDEKTLESFQKYYLPYIKEGTTITIYCNNQFTDSLINNYVKNELSKWNVQVFLSTSMHDRFILLSDAQISIGVGLNFLHVKGIVRKNCTISVTRDLVVPLPENSILKCDYHCEAE